MNVLRSPVSPSLLNENGRCFSAMTMAVVFDLDGTLTQGDTTLPWLRALVGRARLARATAMAVAAWGLPTAEHKRTRFKRALLRHALAGVEVGEAQAAAADLADRIRWRDDIVDTMQGHLDAGDHVVIATGAAEDLAVPLVTARFGVVARIIATPLEVVAGRYTGRLAGANCVREEKSRRVQQWLDQAPPYGHIQGYGNAPDDLAMLALCTSHVVIG